MSQDISRITYEPRNAYLTRYLVWPCALAFAVAAVCSLSVFGLSWYKANLELATHRAILWFFVLWPALTIGLVAFVIVLLLSPLIQERMRQTIIETGAPAQTRHHFTRVNPYKRRPVFESAAKAADADNWTKEAYNVICSLWGKPLTRANFKVAFPNGHKLYYKYVKGNGRERGHFDAMGIIEQIDARGAYRFTGQLEEMQRADPDVWRYAQKQSPTPAIGRVGE